MKLYKQFEKFAVKGNMVDIALGIVIGSVFMETIGVFVKNILLPPLSLVFKTVDLRGKKVDIGACTFIEYGLFIESLLNFLFVGTTMFLIYKAVNHIRDKAFDIEDKTVQTPKDIELLSKILKELEK